MQYKTSNSKFAVVTKGYYKLKTIEVLAIYVTDVKDLLMIPIDEEICSETESFDLLGDTVNELKDKGYEIKYDFEIPKFDITNRYPEVLL